MYYVIVGVGVVRDYGFLLMALVALYSVFRLPFECRLPLNQALLLMWFRKNLTARGIVFRNSFFRMSLYSMVWWIGWSLVVAILVLSFPEAKG
jgi:hypothetical protein